MGDGNKEHIFRQMMKKKYLKKSAAMKPVNVAMEI